MLVLLLALACARDPGPWMDLVPLGADRALALADDGERSTLVLVSLDDGVLWRTELPGRAQDAVRAATQVREGVVSLRLPVEGGSRRFAFDVETGASRWQGADGGVETAGLGAAPLGVTVGDVIVDVLPGAAVEAVGTDTDTGAERWRTRLDGCVSPERIWARDDVAIVECDGALSFLAARTGDRRRDPADPDACVADDLVTWTRTEAGAPRWHAATPAGPPSPLIDVPWRLDGLCGRFGGTVVAAVHDPKAEGNAGARLVALSPGNAAWTSWIDWPEYRFGGGTTTRYAAPDRVAWSGALGRFLPVLLEKPAQSGFDRTAELWFVDLERRAPAWHTRAEAALARAELVAHDGGWFLLRRDIVARFDPATGKLGPVVQVLDGRDPTFAHFAAGRLWVYTAKGIVALDARTLEKLPGGIGADELWVADVRWSIKHQLAPVAAAEAPRGP